MMGYSPSGRLRPNEQPSDKARHVAAPRAAAGRCRAGLAIRPGDWKRHVAAAGPAAGRRRAGLAIRPGDWKRHVAAPRAAAGRGKAGLAIRPGDWKRHVAAARPAGTARSRRRTPGLAIRRGHSPSHAGKRYVAAERAAHGTIARAARKCHAIAATPAASDPHCDAPANSAPSISGTGSGCCRTRAQRRISGDRPVAGVT
jgi:hypothetical protein